MRGTESGGRRSGFLMVGVHTIVNIPEGHSDAISCFRNHKKPKLSHINKKRERKRGGVARSLKASVSVPIGICMKESPSRCRLYTASLLKCESFLDHGGNGLNISTTKKSPRFFSTSVMVFLVANSIRMRIISVCVYVCVCVVFVLHVLRSACVNLLGHLLRMMGVLQWCSAKWAMVSLFNPLGKVGKALEEHSSKGYFTDDILGAALRLEGHQIPTANADRKRYLVTNVQDNDEAETGGETLCYVRRRKKGVHRDKKQNAKPERKGGNRLHFATTTRRYF